MSNNFKLVGQSESCDPDKPEYKTADGVDVQTLQGNKAWFLCGEAGGISYWIEAEVYRIVPDSFEVFGFSVMERKALCNPQQGQIAIRPQELSIARPTEGRCITTVEEYAAFHTQRLMEQLPLYHQMSAMVRANIHEAFASAPVGNLPTREEVLVQFNPTLDQSANGYAQSPANPKKGECAYLRTYLGWCKVQVDADAVTEQIACTVDAWPQEQSALRDSSYLRRTLPPYVPTIDTPEQWRALYTLHDGMVVIDGMPEEVRQQTVQSLILTALGRLPSPSAVEESGERER